MGKKNGAGNKTSDGSGGRYSPAEALQAAKDYWSLKRQVEAGDKRAKKKLDKTAEHLARTVAPWSPRVAIFVLEQIHYYGVKCQVLEIVQHPDDGTWGFMLSTPRQAFMVSFGKSKKE